MTQLTTRPPPPKLIGRYGDGATRNGELVEREPGQLGCCPKPVQRCLLDGWHRRGRPVHVGRVRGEGGDRWQLPPDLRTHLAEMAPLDPNVLYPRETRLPRYPPRTYETLVSSSSKAEWQQRLATAPRFIQYIERDVIGNPAAFGKLTF